MPFDVERGRLRFFAKTIGLTDPIYLDVDAARRAGHRDLPVPPTFLSNSLELELPDPLGWLAALGGDLTTTTHAEQAFTYHALAYAGDSLVLRRRIVDVYTKKGGALEFVVKQNGHQARRASCWPRSISRSRCGIRRLCSAFGT